MRHDAGAGISILGSVNDAQCRQVLAHPEEKYLHRCCSCTGVPMHAKMGKHEIHELTLRSNNRELPFLSFTGSGITEFVERNRSLVSCWLEDFVLGATNEDVARFARVVGASSVRILHLKRMNPAGVCAFLDAIPASHIHTLCVSIEEMSAEKEKAVLASVVQFITDPMRSRSVKYLDISFLSNEAKSVIKHVILGSREALDAACGGA